MTVQASDYVFYKNKRFVLIDVEEGKQLINYVKPSILQRLNEIFNETKISSCWRGYTAQYFINGNILYGIREEIIASRLKRIKSPLRQVRYTGSIIIAFKNDDHLKFSDFIDCYLDYDEAYELFFLNGRLREAHKLDKAIKEYNVDSKKIICDEDSDFKKIHNVRDNVARKHLKYKYDKKNYKWR